ncbi:MAG: ABC transporter substrate-binding protein [Deltaproteobacteria bacterium]|nr:ABC transporter substrate-binding protein [Deltaproteobacteria bacterium]
MFCRKNEIIPASAGLLSVTLIWSLVILCSLAAPGSAKAERVIIAYPSPSVTFLALMVAQKRGFFEEGNLEVDLVKVRSGAALAGMVAGSIDYTTSFGSSVAAMMRGMPIRALMVFTAKPMEFLMGGKGINSASELKGKIVGVNAIGQSEHLLTTRMLKAVGLDPEKDVKFHPLGDEAMRFQGLIVGQIHAATLGPQGVIEGRKAGLNLLLSAADVVELPMAGIVATQGKIKGNPDQVRRLLRAGLKGLKYIGENRSGTIEVIKTWFRLETEVAAATYDLALNSYSRDGEVSEKGIRTSMESARLTGKIEKELSPGDIVDFTFLREIRKGLK